MMKNLRDKIYRFGLILDKAVPVILLFMFAYFAYQTAIAQRQNLSILEDTQSVTRNSNEIVRAQRDILCLLVVHAEESPDVVITQEIRDVCGNIFRPPVTPTDVEPVPPSTTKPSTPADEPPTDPIVEVPIIDPPFCIFDLICLGD